MRSLRPIIILSLSLLVLQSAGAQSADDFFNSGAQLYISNNIPSAKQVVEGGRKLYPDDAKLKKLEELLKQQQQQQSQQNKNQNQQQQQPQSQQNGQNQQKQQDKEKQSAQNQQNQQQKQNQGQQNPQNQPQDQGEQNQAAADRQMSAEEAKRLLDAQKGDEQFLQFKPKNPPENQNRPVKDW